MRRRSSSAPAGARGDTRWYKDAILYELHVRSFQDSNGDGIGDFPGLTARLPYLQDLGITAVWLLPFYPSPLRDDGYDIADYTGVHPHYGTLDDVRRFLDEAHRLGIRVITELVVNHTSDQHAWFARARHAPPGSPERDFYVWSNSPHRYAEARIIFPDFERSNWTWDPVAQAYYWHRFYSHQPDLNYDNPAVFDAIVGVVDHWLGLGVDGMRLDAVPYLVEQEGTASENLGATHAILKRLRAHVDRTFDGRVFIAEANQWPEDAAAYFGDGDESQMVFHFPLMPRLFMAIRQEDRLPVVDILAQTPAPPPHGQWALFLRNHDELTLEMVTEEERLYMYHVYASEEQARINLGIRRRLAPLLGNHRRRIELMNGLLFSLQGTPVLYYGDEIGMGDNIYLGDRNGVRTPMQWSGDRNAGFSSADPQRLVLPLVIDDEYHHQSVHVAQQLRNPSSLLWWMKRLIAARKRYQAFGRGDLAVVRSNNPRVLAFLRCWRDQQMLVVANLSRFVQYVELELDGREGRVPVEVFGRTPMPPIGTAPYPVTLAPHSFLWLELTAGSTRGAAAPFPRLEVDYSWDELLDGPARGDLEAVLPPYLERSTVWNLGARTVLSAGIEQAIPLAGGATRYWLTALRVTFAAGEPERYLLPLGCRRVDRAAQRQRRSDAIAAVVMHATPDARCELFDAAGDPALAAAIVDGAAHDTAAPHGLQLVRAAGARSAAPPRSKGRPAARREWEDDSGGASGVEGPLRRSRRGTNALFAVNGRAVLKLFRVLERGPNPEIEMRSHLTGAGFRHSPPVLAGLRWTFADGGSHESLWIGILQTLVDNEGEAWRHAVAAARGYLRRALRRRERPPALDSIVPTPLPDGGGDAGLDTLIGRFLDDVRRIGSRMADLHRALGSPTADPAFAVEVSTPFSRRSAYQRMRRLAVSVGEAFQASAPALDPDVHRLAGRVLERRQAALALFERLLHRAAEWPRIRCHGNLHLGQVLYAGGDLVILDFDGEPGRPLYERRLKQSPLHDAAAMVRSFHYAAHAALQEVEPGRPAADALAWMRAWQSRVGAVFVDSYCRAMEDSGLLPSDADNARILFHTHLVERAFYEAGFELNRRSRWVRAPLLDLPLLLEAPAAPPPRLAGGLQSPPLAKARRRVG